MPKKPVGDLLAGDVSVSLCPVTGSPIATLAHPDGGSCQVAVCGACVISWRPARDGGIERLLPCERTGDKGEADRAPAPAGSAASSAGGLRPCNLGLIPTTAWTVEMLRGRVEQDGPLSVSLFADVAAAGFAGADALAEEQRGSGQLAAPMAARATISLWPERLTVELEVANAAEEEDLAASSVNLGCCGFAGQCCGGAAEDAQMSTTGEAPASPQNPLAGIGLRLETEGFSSVTASAGASAASTQFEALTPEPIKVAPGQVLSGQIALALL